MVDEYLVIEGRADEALAFHLHSTTQVFETRSLRVDSPIFLARSKFFSFGVEPFLQLTRKRSSPPLPELARSPDRFTNCRSSCVSAEPVVARFVTRGGPIVAGSIMSIWSRLNGVPNSTLSRLPTTTSMPNDRGSGLRREPEWLARRTNAATCLPFDLPGTQRGWVWTLNSRGRSVTSRPASNPGRSARSANSSCVSGPPSTPWREPGPDHASPPGLLGLLGLCVTYVVRIEGASGHRSAGRSFPMAP